MRQTSELLKVVMDSDRVEQSLAMVEGKERVTLPVPAENQLSEVSEFSHLQPLMRPHYESELSLARIDQHLVSFQDVHPESASQFTRLAVTLIAQATKHPPLKRVLLVSAHHGEGRTCVTLNLAAALARARQRVLVVDTDLLRPSVNRLLGVDTEVGLAEALADKLPPEAAITRLLPVRFDILPTRSQVENSAELLTSPDFASMLTSLDPSYDFILFDSAPLLSSADSNLIMLHTDATMLVVRPGTTTAKQMSKAITLLNQESLLGVVINRVN